MTKEELAATINGREYGEELSDVEEKAAKSSRLVAIFGASDDLCEFRGAIHDEVGAYRKCTVLIASNGTLLEEMTEDDQEVLKKYNVLDTVLAMREDAIEINVQWHNEGLPYWTCATEAPHAEFDVMEGEDKFCRGLVIDLKELALNGRS